jgi:hypothetical protein
VGLGAGTGVGGLAGSERLAGILGGGGWPRIDIRAGIGGSLRRLLAVIEDSEGIGWCLGRSWREAFRFLSDFRPVFRQLIQVAYTLLTGPAEGSFKKAEIGRRW